MAASSGPIPKAPGSAGGYLPEAQMRAIFAILAGDELAFDLVFSDVIMPGMNGVEVDAIQTGCQVCCGPTTDSGHLREKLRG